MTTSAQERNQVYPNRHTKQRRRWARVHSPGILVAPAAVFSSCTNPSLVSAKPAARQSHRYVDRALVHPNGSRVVFVDEIRWACGGEAPVTGGGGDQIEGILAPDGDIHQVTIWRADHNT